MARRELLVGRCLLSACLLYFGIPIEQANGDAEQPKPSAPPSAQCGIYAVYGALHSLGIECNFADLVSVKYISTPFGSTLDDLKLAIEDHGGYALPMKNLSLAELRAAKSPMVLHFSPEGRYGEYNHWVLFVGFQGGKARLIDSQDFSVHLSPAELLARWDGMGLVASKHPMTGLEVIYPSWLTWLQVVVLLVTLIWGLRVIFPAFALPGLAFTKSKSLKVSVAMLISGCAVFVLVSSGIGWV